MRLPWLDELVKEGHVTQAMCDEIYADCDTLIKTAMAEPLTGNWKHLQDGLTTGVATAMIGGAIAGWKYMQGRMDVNSVMKSLANTKKSLVESPEFPDKEKLVARFNEVASIAPSVAGNSPFMHRLMKDKVNSGLTDHDVERLALIQAQHTPSLKKQTALQQKVAAARLGEWYADAVYMIKEAAPISNDTLLKALGSFLFISSAPLLAGLGTGTVNALMAKRDRKSLEQRHREVFEEAVRLSDPQKEPLHENRERAMQAYKTLVHFAPHVATEPSAARAFMSKMVGYNQGIDVSAVKELAEIEKNMQSVSKPSPFFSGLAAGSNALGLEKLVSTTMADATKPLRHDITSSIAKDMGYEVNDEKGGFRKADKGGFKGSGF